MFTARDNKLTEKEAEARLLAEVPLGIVIEPEDISDLAVFLASARAACDQRDGDQRGRRAGHGASKRVSREA